MPRKKGASATVEPETIETPEMTEAVETAAAAEAKTSRQKGTPLQGEEFKQYLANNKGKPVDEVAYNAGFYTIVTDLETGETKTTIHKNEFYSAMIAALTGIAFEAPKRAYTARKNRAPVISVTTIGNIVVGSRHSDVAGFASGDKILVTASEGQIVLTLHAKAEPKAAEEVEIDEEMEVEEEDGFDL